MINAKLKRANTSQYRWDKYEEQNRDLCNSINSTIESVKDTYSVDFFVKPLAEMWNVMLWLEFYGYSTTDLNDKDKNGAWIRIYW